MAELKEMMSALLDPGVTEENKGTLFGFKAVYKGTQTLKKGN